jgi:hypothetical protein
MEIAEIVFSKIPPTSQRQAIIDEVVSGKREKRQRSPTADRMRVDAFASRKTYDRMIEGYVKQGNIQQALTFDVLSILASNCPPCRRDLVTPGIWKK